MRQILVCICLSALLLTACQGQATDVQVTTDLQKESYSIGYQIGSDFSQQGIEVDPQVLARGMADAIGAKEALLNEEQRMATLQALQQRLMEKQMAMLEQREQEMNAQGEKNKSEGEAFLAANKQKEGVKTTASGLQYKVIAPGSGKAPGPSDEVTVHYRGTLIDGTEFDSSIARGTPATFPVNGVIKGWTEALQLMKPGAKFELYIPSNLAYGERGAGDRIGPNSVLVFEVELLKVN